MDKIIQSLIIFFLIFLIFKYNLYLYIIIYIKFIFDNIILSYIIPIYFLIIFHGCYKNS